MDTAVERHTVADLPQLIEEVAYIDTRVDELMNEVNRLKQRRWLLETRIIPTVLTENGQRECTMDDGTEIKVTDAVAGGIPIRDADKAAAAIRHLREIGHGDLVRNTITAMFAPGQDNMAKDLESRLLEMGVTFDKKEFVNPQTLLAWARRQLADGEIIDLETLGLSQQLHAKIKFKKGSNRVL